MQKGFADKRGDEDESCLQGDGVADREVEARGE